MGAVMSAYSSYCAEMSYFSPCSAKTYDFSLYSAETYYKSTLALMHTLVCRKCTWPSSPVHRMDGKCPEFMLHSLQYRGIYKQSKLCKDVRLCPCSAETYYFSPCRAEMSAFRPCYAEMSAFSSCCAEMSDFSPCSRLCCPCSIPCSPYSSPCRSRRTCTRSSWGSRVLPRRSWTEVGPH